MTGHPFLTVRDVAEELRMSESQVRALIRTKQIKALRIPGTGKKHRMLRIERGALQAFLESAASVDAEREQQPVHLRAVK
jgi:excisionase family DNA binding protein